MDTIQAAVLLEILKTFPDEVVKRQSIGTRYNDSLYKINKIKIPTIDENNTSVFAQYTILSKNRDEIKTILKHKGIPSVSYYSVPLHLQPVFDYLDYKLGNFPTVEKVADECLSLPMSPHLSNEDQSLIINTISNI